MISAPALLCCRASVQRTCMLDVLLFSEAVAAGDQLMPHLFPVNSLRCLSASRNPWHPHVYNSGKDQEAP